MEYTIYKTAKLINNAMRNYFNNEKNNTTVR